MRVLAQPFRLDPLKPGELATVVQGDDAQKAQEIAGFLRTHKEERPIYQEFGISDPSFDIFDDSEIAADFAGFYETIQLQTLEINEDNTGTVRVSVDFE